MVSRSHSDDRGWLNLAKILLLTHVGLVLLGLGYFLLAVATPTEDANIGAGLAMLWLGLLGLPWSWPLWDSRLSGGPLLAAVTAAALLNVVLHLLIHVWLRRRRSGRCGRITPRG